MSFEMKTFLPKVDQIERKWFVIDAEGQVLGRLAVKIANILRGKHKPEFTAHLDCGDYVVVINAEKVVLTGRKNENKEYQDFTGYIYGLKRYTAATIREKNPTRMISDAVWGMLPKGILGRSQFSKLKVYAGAGPDHQYKAQKAEILVLN